jgi:hypothetical protein
MGWTKEQLVDAAFEELTLAEGDGFGITPGREGARAGRLDAMLATWAAKGMRLGYAFPASPSTPASMTIRAFRTAPSRRCS